MARQQGLWQSMASAVISGVVVLVVGWAFTASVYKGRLAQLESKTIDLGKLQAHQQGLIDSQLLTELKELRLAKDSLVRQLENILRQQNESESRLALVSLRLEAFRRSRSSKDVTQNDLDKVKRKIRIDLVSLSPDRLRGRNPIDRVVGQQIDSTEAPIFYAMTTLSDNGFAVLETATDVRRAISKPVRNTIRYYPTSEAAALKVQELLVDLPAFDLVPAELGMLQRNGGSPFVEVLFASVVPARVADLDSPSLKNPR